MIFLLVGLGGIFLTFVKFSWQLSNQGKFVKKSKKAWHLSKKIDIDICQEFFVVTIVIFFDNDICQEFFVVTIVKFFWQWHLSRVFCLDNCQFFLDKSFVKLSNHLSNCQTLEPLFFTKHFWNHNIYYFHFWSFWKFHFLRKYSEDRWALDDPREFLNYLGFLRWG